MKVIYCTGNKYKLATARQILGPMGVEVEGKKIENLPEIQADTIEEVAVFSSKYACKMLNENVLKNDSGLVIPALKNFPSAYTKYVEETIGEDGILKLMQGINNREAYFVEVLAYTEVGQEPKVFKSVTKGSIAEEKSGEYGWSYDKIFVPEGESKTLASFPDDERWKFWNEDGYKEFAGYIKSNTGVKTK